MLQFALVAMASFISCSALLLLSFLSYFGAVSAQLSPNFYATSCPTALSIIRKGVMAAVAKDYRMGASLLRLHFHDCFVNGCDASVLLDDTSDLKGEKTASPNLNSLRGFEVVDSIKSQLESACPQTVSCADILAVAARDSVAVLRGPSWTVPLGRRDSTTASFDGANSDLPSPFSDLSDLVSAFSKKGLSSTDMVALSGAHSIGQARCITFRDRVHNETTIEASFATSRKSNCPTSGGDDSLAPLDAGTSTIFDNFYYKNLVMQRGLLHSDQALFSNGSSDALVQSYSANMGLFFGDFMTAMVKMGNIDVLTGSSGQVRTNCGKVN